MRMLMWLVLVAASTLVAACATGPTQGTVTIDTQLDFTEEPFNRTFRQVRLRSRMERAILRHDLR